MKSANTCVLTIDGGSSSIKFAVYQNCKPLKRTLHGAVERIGVSGTALTFDDPATQQDDNRPLDASSHGAAMAGLSHKLLDAQR